MVARSEKICIVTGFYIASATPPAPETDGPSSAINLSFNLLLQGKQVCLLTDTCCFGVISSTVRELQMRRSELPALSVMHPGMPDFAKAFRTAEMLIFIEKCGQGKDGACRSMRGVDITEFTDPVFSNYGQANPRAASFGVGDGGNEICCGNFEFKNLTPKNIKCVVPTDGAILCDISNFGALLLSRTIVSKQHLTYFQNNLKEDELVALLVKNGAVDGVLGQRVVSVDAMDFSQYAEVCRQLWE